MAAAVLAAALAASCSSSTDADGSAGAGQPVAASGSTSTTAAPSTAAARFPGATWAPVDPASVGLRAAPLAEITGAVANTDTDCVAVVKGGELVHESTYNGKTGDTDQIVFSVSKSLTSILVGIAQEQGKLRIDQSASDFVPEWKGTPKEAITIRHLLTMTSGLDADFRKDFITLTAAEDRSAFAAAYPLGHEPGTHWQYLNGGVQILEIVLRKATGRDVPGYADEFLFRPIGVEMTWDVDTKGQPMTYGGAKMSCRDLARVGLLFQRKGRWGDRQIVSEAWVPESTRTSQEVNRGYGYLWWPNVGGNAGTDGTGTGAETTATTGAAARPQPSLGEDAYSANGARGQFIVVAPTEDLVVIRTGRDGAAGERLKNPRGVLRFVVEQAVASTKAG